MTIKQKLKHCGKFAIIAVCLSTALYITAQYFMLIEEVSAVTMPINAKKVVVVEVIEPELSIQEHVIGIMQNEYGLNWEETAEAIAIIKWYIPLILFTPVF